MSSRIARRSAASLGEIAYGIDRLALGRIDDIGCPEPTSGLESFRLNVDHHSSRGACQARAACGIETDAARAEDHDRFTGLHVRGVQDGAGARDDAASEQRCLSEGHLL